MDLTDVLRRVLSGDAQAYAEIVARYERPLFGFLGRMGLPQAHAEDVAQETFLRAWQHLGTFDSRRASFTTWLYTIARRLALNDAARAAARRDVGMTIAHDGACEAPQPLATLAAAEQRERLRAALLGLSTADRTTLALAYIEDLSLAEIAQIESTTVGAVKTRLHRARGRLAQLMEKAPMEKTDE
jgi:RNA polymerase sigma-70 factor (ECF subfamily)